MDKEKKKILAEIFLIILVCSYNNKFIIAFLWIFLHEITHIIIAAKYGCKFHNINLSIFGVNAEVSEIDILKDKEKIIIYSCGSIINLIFAIILYIFSFKYNNNFINTSIFLNIGLGIFNLLPAYPLDGSRILEILLSKKMLFKRAHKIISLISFIIATLFILSSIYLYIFLHILNISLILGGIIIIYVTKVEEKTSMYITMGNVVKKRKKLLKDKYIENKSISVYYKQGLINVLSLVDRNKFNSFFILNDDMELIYTLYEDELISALKKYGNITLEEYIKEIK